VSLAGIPLALVNIMLRPFLFEAHNFMALLTALEITAFWMIVWVRRKTFVYAIRNWRHDRLLRVAIPFVLFYSIALGMAVNNMGLIARQRIFIFPFLFLLIEAVPRVQRAVSRAPVSAPQRVGAPRNRGRALAPAARSAVQGVR
jgi:hypothetical protein